ncbi:MAG: ABC transporter ATP-binding protein [Pseudomonadota bacterium]
MVAAVSFKNVSKHYGRVRAVDNVDFEVRDGEFFAMLGPSGSGKTTCLRLIAGFETPTAGDILIWNTSTANLPPYERNVNTVFQDYALFPHMTVLENVCYGLMVKGVGKKIRSRRGEEMLELVKLGGFGGRKPAQLSGGQRQRVALARALINQPRVLLLDEPLGALDLKLRKQMQVELKALQRVLGITFIFVTHDQEEALGMSDRLSVFNEGRIEQIGTPEEVYEKPATRFVADFVGDANIVEADQAEPLIGQAAAFSIRPEKIRIIDLGAALGENCCLLKGQVMDIQFHGAGTRYTFEVESGARLLVLSQNVGFPGTDLTTRLGVGAWACLAWRREDMRVFGAGEA